MASRKSFTLIELLVVIAIIIILAAAVLIAINPLGMMQKGRDATRLSDIATMRDAINVTLAAGIVPADTAMRDSFTDGRNCAGGAADWVNINLCDYLGSLPVDPTNNADFQYQYAASGGKYELRVKLEHSDNQTKMTTDGGDDDGWYEMGTSLTIL